MEQFRNLVWYIVSFAGNACCWTAEAYYLNSLIIIIWEGAYINVDSVMLEEFCTSHLPTLHIFGTFCSYHFVWFQFTELPSNVSINKKKEKRAFRFWCGSWYVTYGWEVVNRHVWSRRFINVTLRNRFINVN